MTRPQWSLAGLLSAVMFAAIAAGAYKALWSPDHPNAWFWLSIYLAVVSSATIGVWRGRPVVRRACLGYAAFGWVQVAIVVILFGWPLTTIYDAERMVSNVQIGMFLGLLCAIAATWLLPPPA
jgi:hypothetical protein